MDSATLTRALAAIQAAGDRAEVAIDAWRYVHHWVGQRGPVPQGTQELVPEIDAGLRQVRALAAVALAAARVVGARSFEVAPGDHRPWWAASSSSGLCWCRCNTVDVRWRWQDIVHAPDCAAMELESALTELAGEGSGA